MFRNIVDIKKEVAVLDIGTSTVCAAIMKREKSEHSNTSLGLLGETRVLGVGYQLAKGMKVGVINDFESLEEAILGAVASAEKEAERTIKSVFVSIPTWAIESHAVESSTSIGQIPVDEIHLSSLLNFDTSEYIDEHKEIIHTFPISYSVDGNSGIKDPRGTVGNKLSATFHVLTAPSLFLKNIRNCLNRNNIEVLGFINSTYASIGYIPLGGQSITDDISKVLRITRASAERLKILHGVSGNITGDEQVLVTRVDEYGEEHAQNISRKMLDAIISARLEEILDKVQEHIYNCGADKVMYQSIVLTGGGSQLSGLSEFIRLKKYFSDVSVRLGKPIGVTGSHDFVRTQAFASTAGTALYCLGEFAGKNFQDKGKSIWQRLMIWFKRGV